MHDCITDMYCLRARYYCADTGRFAQEDTYHGDGLNLYVYAGNNPVKYVDPSGHESQNGVGGVNEGGIHSLSNVEARKWYFEQGAKIPDMIDKSLSLEG